MVVKLSVRRNSIAVEGLGFVVRGRVQDLMSIIEYTDRIEV
jgi:hypothetical protein